MTKMSQASHTSHEFITHILCSSLHKNGNNTPAIKTRPNVIVASTSDGKHIISATHDLHKQGPNIILLQQVMETQHHFHSSERNTK